MDTNLLEQHVSLLRFEDAARIQSYLKEGDCLMAAAIAADALELDYGVGLDYVYAIREGFNTLETICKRVSVLQDKRLKKRKQVEAKVVFERKCYEAWK